MRIIQCNYCRFKAPEPMFKWGKGKEFGQHPEHRYCVSRKLPKNKTTTSLAYGLFGGM